MGGSAVFTNGGGGWSNWRLQLWIRRAMATSPPRMFPRSPFQPPTHTYTRTHAHMHLTHATLSSLSPARMHRQLVAHPEDGIAYLALIAKDLKWITEVCVCMHACMLRYACMHCLLANALAVACIFVFRRKWPR